MASHHVVGSRRVASRGALSRPPCARTLNSIRRSTRSAGRQQRGAASVDRRDFVAEPDRAADEDVGTQPAAVDERTEETRSRELLEVSAWLGEAASDAFDAADPKATADKGIE
jgi:hypothetical protein